MLALCAQSALPVRSSFSQTYDYVILGGGLTIANRLTEDHHKQVLVLEAGEAHLDDPLVDIPGFLGSTVGNASYDWLFSTAPQVHANNNTFIWNRGKMLGGSTGINFMAFTRPAENEIDAIGALGNPGWTGENLFKYMRKAETFTHPDPVYAAVNNLTFIPAAHGTRGPLHNSFSKFISDAQKPWLSAFQSLGVQKIEDALAGEDVGAWMAPATIDGVSITRSYAASAYYVPVSDRANLVVVTGAEATRIVSTNDNGLLRATAVEFSLGSQCHSISVKPGAEVILSAGTIKTPQLLELSGIGNPQILDGLGIDTKVDLPGVGEGIIDQFFFGVSFELKNDSIVTLDDLRDPTFLAEALAEYAANKTGIMTIGVTEFALVPLQTILGDTQATSLIDAQAVNIATGNYSATQKEKWDVIIQGLREPTRRGYIELVAFPGFFTTASLHIRVPQAGKKYVTFTGALHFPFSTGSIHAASSDPTVQPTINPHYFEQDFDLTAMVGVLKFLRKLGNLFASEIDPGLSVQTDEEIMDYIKNHGSPEYHTVGSAAMLPREKGGVVSPELKVYGTSNIRIVDYSILPLQISAHPMSTLYGIAEKAADIIRGIVTV
ncbi:GMC oxidoreductase [Mycena galericulata]|nr:GMC oxidoreductase [Mycena galericulata]